MVSLGSTNQDKLQKMSRTLIFIAPSFPHPVSAFLVERGYEVLEARSTAEADAFVNLSDVDAVIIAPGSEHLFLDDIRHRRVTLNLSVHATGSDVFFELSNLFDSPPNRLQ
jgi:hypothetical protein